MRGGRGGREEQEAVEEEEAARRCDKGSPFPDSARASTTGTRTDGYVSPAAVRACVTGVCRTVCRTVQRVRHVGYMCS